MTKRDVDSGLTPARLREVLHYDPETGIFTWRQALARHTKVGLPTGMRANGAGYLRITVDGFTFRAHRLAWFFVHGSWPAGEIDHRNGQPADNRICNLRDATPMVNQQNKRCAQSNSKTGVLGVSWSTREEKYVARIKVGGKYKSLGQHTSIETAAAAYLAAKRRYHEGCTI